MTSQAYLLLTLVFYTAGAIHVAERARQAVAAADGTISASVGVATFPQDGTSATDVLLAADHVRR